MSGDSEPPPSASRRAWHFLIVWAWIPVTIGILAVLAFWIDLSKLRATLAQADLVFAASMLSSWLVWLTIRPLRMAALLRAMQGGKSIGFNAVFGAHALGCSVNSVLPMRAGEVATIFVLRMRAGVPAGIGASCVLVDRAFDFLSAMALLCIALLALPTVSPIQERAIGFFATFLAMALVGAAGFFVLRRRMRAWLPKFGPAWLHRTLLHIIDGLDVLGRPATLLVALAWTVAVSAALVAWAYFGIRAFWPDAAPAMAAFFLGVVALTFLVPAAPGGIGVFHGAAVFALAAFSVPPEVALAFAIASHALNFIAGHLVSGVWVVVNGLDPRLLFRRVDPGA